MAWIAMLRSVAPAPTRRHGPSTSIAASGPRRRTTTPSMPPSRTRRLEATPIGVTGRPAGRAARNASRSPASAGSNSASAGPPARSHVRGASGTSRSQRPRTGGRVCAPVMPRAPRRAAPCSASGRALAQAVMLPAPRHTTRSPGCGDRRHQRRQLLGAVQRAHVAMAVAAHAVDQRVAVDALDRRLAGGIDRGDQHAVGMVEGGAEVLEQRLQAAVAMRLDDRDDPRPA